MVQIPDMTVLLSAIYLGVVADRRTVVPETNEDDNDIARRVGIVRREDRLENNDTIEHAVRLGGLFSTITESGLNISRSDDDDWFSFYLPETGTPEDLIRIRHPAGSDFGVVIEVLDEQNSLVLRGDSRSSASGIEEVHSLVGLPPGLYFLHIYSGHGAPGTYDLEINSAMRTRAELTTTIADFPTILRPTLAKNIRIGLANYGATAAHDFDVTVFLQTANQQIPLAPPPKVPVLGANSSTDLILALTAPSDLPPGDYTIQIFLDAQSVVPELNEADNRIDATVRLSRVPDKNEIREGTTGFTDLGVIRGVFADSGLNLDSSVDHDLFRFYLAAPGPAGSRVEGAFQHAQGNIDLFLFDGNGRQIANSTSNTNTETITLEGRSDGIYYLSIENLDPNNNGSPAYTLTLTVPNTPGPNLAVIGLALGKERYLPGDALAATSQISNLGDATAGAFAVRYYLSADNFVDPLTDRPLTASLATASIAPGAVSQNVHSFKLPADLAAGRYYLGLALDADRQIRYLRWRFQESLDVMFSIIIRLLMGPIREQMLLMMPPWPPTNQLSFPVSHPPLPITPITAVASMEL